MNEIIINDGYIENELTLETTLNTELHFGSQSGRIVHIDEVANGLSCDCRCPYCGGELVAKKGHIRVHHFAHYNSIDCEHGPETAIHLMAKQIIAERKLVQLPAQYMRVCGYDSNHGQHQASDFIDSQLSIFSQVHLEPKMEGYRPDLTVQLLDGAWLDIEIKVTHEVGIKKAEDQIMRQRDMLEIDLSLLSRTCTVKELEEAVLFLAPRHYIYASSTNGLEPKLTNEVGNTLEYVNGLITTSNEKQRPCDLSTTIGHKNIVMIVGYKFGCGFSKKNQCQFTIRQLFCVVPVQKNGTANFNVRVSDGFEFKQVDIEETLIPLLETLSFPVEAQLKYRIESSCGHRNKWIVSEILVQ